MNSVTDFRAKALELHNKLGEMTYVAEGLYQLGASIDQGEICVSMIPRDYPFTVLQKYVPEMRGLYNQYDGLLGHEIQSLDLEMGLHEVRWLAETLASLDLVQQEKSLNMGFYTLSNSLRRMQAIVAEQLGLHGQATEAEANHVQ